jgi:hypothetical protein
MRQATHSSAAPAAFCSMNQGVMSPTRWTGLAAHFCFGGGDTDTSAAICGALLGAAQGRAAIPVRWSMAVLACRPLSETGARQPGPLDIGRMTFRCWQRRCWRGRGTRIERNLI